MTIWKHFRSSDIPLLFGIRIISSCFKSNIQEASYSKASSWKSRQTWTKWGRDDRITMKGIPVHTSSRIIHIYPTYGFFPFPSIPLENVHRKKVFLHLSYYVIDHNSFINDERLHAQIMNVSLSLSLSINLPVKYTCQRNQTRKTS